MGFLSGLVLSFLLGVFILIHVLFVAGLLGSLGSFTLLDLTNGVFSQSFFVFRTSSFHFLDVFKGDTFDSSLLFEDFFLFVFSSIGLF